jgi:hypothetical protein
VRKTPRKTTENAPIYALCGIIIPEYNEPPQSGGSSLNKGNAPAFALIRKAALMERFSVFNVER